MSKLYPSEYFRTELAKTPESGLKEATARLYGDKLVVPKIFNNVDDW